MGTTEPVDSPSLDHPFCTNSKYGGTLIDSLSLSNRTPRQRRSFSLRMKTKSEKHVKNIGDSGDNAMYNDDEEGELSYMYSSSPPPPAPSEISPAATGNERKSMRSNRPASS